MKRVKVNLDRNGYEICIGTGLLGQAGQYLRETGLSGRLVMVTDTRVNRLYGEGLKKALTADGFAVNLLEVPEGETQKSLQTAGRLYEELGRMNAERLTPILALGGGVIGDLAGFVAATYMRGVPLVQMPTTLLAQVDSSIGGKVAVNHGTLKNMVGAFYQPRLVLSDISTLKSLPASEVSDGLAEIIKYAVIGDRDLFVYLEDNMERLKELDEAVLEEVISRCAAIKASVVAADELDLGPRNVLNYGHTIGHALESASDFKMGHGEAVALGMLAAGRISDRLGMLASGELERLRNIIQRASLPVTMPPLDVVEILQAVKHDKKVIGGKLRFVLAKSIGEVMVQEVPAHLIEPILGDLK